WTLKQHFVSTSFIVCIRLTRHKEILSAARVILKRVEMGHTLRGIRKGLNFWSNRIALLADPHDSVAFRRNTDRVMRCAAILTQRTAVSNGVPMKVVARNRRRVGRIVHSALIFLAIQVLDLLRMYRSGTCD